MRYSLQITIVGIVLALIGSSGSAFARPAHQHRYGPGNPRVNSSRRVRSHQRIVGNWRTRVHYLSQMPSRLPAPQNRVYFRTPAEARAAGYRPAPRNAIPVSPQLTWQGAQSLPSIGKHHVPPPPPKDMQRPVAPPADQQPPVTPTDPMPN
jgi:metal binding Ada-like protein